MADLSILRDYVYRYIVSQLMYDGLNNYAAVIAGAVGIDVQTLFPNCDLYKICVAKISQERIHEKKKFEEKLAPLEERMQFEGLDMITKKSKNISSSLQINQYETLYVTSHKGPCTVGAFSKDGKYVATGSYDTSIKVMDTFKLVLKASENKMEKQQIDLREEENPMLSKNHPVVKTLYDHNGGINCMEFHPQHNFLASGGDDCVIYFFDLNKSTSKKPVKAINEVDKLTSINFHPSGDYMLVATRSPTIRLYDINTLNCFVGSLPSDQHKCCVNTIKYNPSGSFYASGGVDGAIKFWDGVSNRCFNTIQYAHSGTPITSLVFKSDGRTILSTGKDNVIRIWDIRKGENFIDINCPSQNFENLCPAVFNHNENLVIYAEENNNSIGCCDAKTGEKQPAIPSGHTNFIRYIAHSPVEPSFVTASEDYRTRFWHAGHF